MWYESLLDFLLNLISSDIFCTVIGGVLVFVISQWLLELVIIPRVEYKKLIGKILYSLNYYADVISNPMIIHRDKAMEEFKIFADSKHAQASEELRKLGCEITTFTFKKKPNDHISSELIYLSNAIWSYEDLAPMKADRTSIRLRNLIDFIKKTKNKAKRK